MPRSLAGDEVPGNLRHHQWKCLDEMAIMRLYLKGTLVVAVVIAASALAGITMVVGTSFIDTGVTTAKVAIGPCTNHGKSLFHFVFGWLR